MGLRILRTDPAIAKEKQRQYRQEAERFSRVNAGDDDTLYADFLKKLQTISEKMTTHHHATSTAQRLEEKIKDQKAENLHANVKIQPKSLLDLL